MPLLPQEEAKIPKKSGFLRGACLFEEKLYSVNWILWEFPYDATGIYLTNYIFQMCCTLYTQLGERKWLRCLMNYWPLSKNVVEDIVSWERLRFLSEDMACTSEDFQPRYYLPRTSKIYSTMYTQASYESGFVYTIKGSVITVGNFSVLTWFHIFYKSFKTWNLPLQKSYCDHSNQPSRLQKIFHFLGPEGQTKYFLYVSHWAPQESYGFFFKMITTKQDSVYSTQHFICLIYSSFFFLCLSSFKLSLLIFYFQPIQFYPLYFLPTLKKFLGPIVP